MSWRQLMLVSVLLCAAVAGGHLAQSRLDSIRPKEGFRELLYIPEGETLHLMAFGFEAPLADLLFLKGRIYFSDNLRATQLRHNPDARYRYIFRIHDAITDLAPRFGRAYLYGAIYLFSTGREKLVKEGAQLLEKGIEAYDRAERNGQPITPDIRWRLYMHLGNAYDQQLGDMNTAIQYFEKAVNQPGAPESLIHAYAGFRQQFNVGRGILERLDTMISVWTELRQVLDKRGGDEQMRTEIAKRLERLHKERARVKVTMDAEARLTEASRKYADTKGHPPTTQQELIEAGLLQGPQPMPLFKNNLFNDSPDWWMFLPDGRVRSYVLARQQARMESDRIYESVDRFYHTHHNRFPGRIELLLKNGYLESNPVHPLALLGYRYTFDPRNGFIGIYDPEYDRIMPRDYLSVPGQPPAETETESP